MGATLRASLRLPKITRGDFVTSFNSGYDAAYCGVYGVGVI
jgi:hypothetical protein